MRTEKKIKKGCAVRALSYSMVNIGLNIQMQQRQGQLIIGLSHSKSLGYQDRQAALDADSICSSTITLTPRIALAADPPVSFAPFPVYLDPQNL